MTPSQIVGCQQEGCPIVTEGRCLENFPEGEGCPYASTDATKAADGVSEGQVPNESAPEPSEETRAVDTSGQAEEQLPETAPETNRVELGGEESLTISQADEVAARYGAEVVLVAGEFQSGKTTLVAELYGRFLSGPYCGWSFAGADALCALDRRYHGARASSGLEQPDTGRTEEEEMRVLDLRLRKDRRLLQLMFSDVRGEFFDNVTQGAPVADQVTLAARSNRALILLDADKVKDKFLRAGVFSRARQLIGGLTESGGLRTGIPMGIVLAKTDLVDAGTVEWFSEQATGLREFALSRGCGRVDVFLTAARPDESPHEPEGLEAVFEWLIEDGAQTVSVPSTAPTGLRSYWRPGAR